VGGATGADRLLKETTMIVTHTSPDWDAIAAVWLLKRHGGMSDAPVVFVNTGNPDTTALAEADAVVDTGREYDPARRRFDHHQFGATANDVCATSLVYADVVNPKGGYEYLDPLVRLIFDGDTGKPGANLSRTAGIHALLSARKARRESDAALMEWGCGVLDDLAAHLQAREEARRTLRQYTVWQSDDGRVRALFGAPQSATFAAFEDGARLVVFATPGEETNACGVMRGGEGDEPSCKALVLGLLNDGEGEAPWAPRWDSAEYAEMVRWFLHPAGFFAGRGTQKAPDPTPLTASVTLIAQAIDRAWQR
jgi:hypothetical protein